MSDDTSPKAAYIIGFMVAVAALFGAGVTGIYIGSARTLERNSALSWQRALVEVFDLGDPATLATSDLAALVNRHVVTDAGVMDPATGRELDLLKAYRDDAREVLIGYGVPFRGLGFWAPIEGILALTPDLTETMGLVILEQAETPGLGGRIEEAIFTRQFEDGVRISPAADGAFIRVVAPGTPDPDGRQVDAITGATQTSVAMERILNDTLRRYYPALTSAKPTN